MNERQAIQKRMSKKKEVQFRTSEQTFLYYPGESVIKVIALALIYS
jgi:hypothetical protein